MKPLPHFMAAEEISQCLYPVHSGPAPWALLGQQAHAAPQGLKGQNIGPETLARLVREGMIVGVARNGFNAPNRGRRGRDHRPSANYRG